MDQNDFEEVPDEIEDVRVSEDGEYRVMFMDVVASDWYAKYVCFAKDKGIIGGYPDGTFKPAQNVNVAEALKIVLETYFGNVTPVDGEWYQKYVDYAHKHDFWLDERVSESYLLKRGEMAGLMYNGYYVD